MVLHDGHDHQETETEQSTARNARVARVLFVFYTALYLGYVLLVTFKPEIMARTPLAGVNLAVLYGFGLIVGAFLLAVLYAMLCRKAADAET